MKIEFLIQDLKSARFSCQNENFVNTSKILWKNTEAATRGVLMKKACNFIRKQSLTQVFFGEFCKISNSNFFTEHLWTAVLKIEITLVLI